MRILVTGGAGFIGSHLVDKLIEDGHTVAVLDNLDSQVHKVHKKWPEWLHSKAVLHYCDIRDADDVNNVMRGFEPHVVVHLAAQVGVGQGQYEMASYADTNVSGTAVLLEAIARTKGTKRPVERLIVASSMSCYGEGQYVCEDHGMVRASPRTDKQMERGMWLPFCGLNMGDGPCRKTPVPTMIAEWASLRPRGIYASTKRSTEELALLFGEAYGIPVAAARLFNTYGPRQALGNPYTGVAAIFAAQILAGQAPTIYEDGWQARDFTHVSDIASGLAMLVGPRSVKLARKQWASPKAQGSFNLGTGVATTLIDLAEKLIELSGVVLVHKGQTLGPTEIGGFPEVTTLKPDVTGQFRSGDIRCCYADRSRMQQLGWEPKVTLGEGLAEYWPWVSEQVAEGRKLQCVAHEELEERGLIKQAKP